MKEILKVTRPSAFGYGGAALGFTVLNGLIQSYGTSVLAAYSNGKPHLGFINTTADGNWCGVNSHHRTEHGAELYDRAHAI